MNKILIAPSILSADFANLQRDVETVEKSGADWLHIDVMDGHFVPNITIGPVVVKRLRPRTKLFFDVHLMLERPDRYWKEFAAAGANLITVHEEADCDVRALVAEMRAAGLKSGVSVRPGTPTSKILPFVGLVDLVLVMTVEPGFGGQAFMPEMLPRIEIVRQQIERDNPSCLLEVDGGINRNTALSAVRAGAGVLVAGNSIFGEKDAGQALKAIRKEVEEA